MQFRRVINVRTGEEANTVQEVSTGAFYSKQSTEYLEWIANPENELLPALED